MRRICFKTVDFPLSPAPRMKDEYTDRERDQWIKRPYQAEEL